MEMWRVNMDGVSERHRKQSKLPESHTWVSPLKNKDNVPYDIIVNFPWISPFLFLDEILDEI